MKTRTFVFSLAVVLAYLLVCISSAMAAKGGIKGPPDGGEGEAGNQLSMPAVVFTGVSSIPATWIVPAGVLGEDYSYGCDQPESDGHFSYPNTSCVNNLMAPTDYYTAEVCVQLGHPCYGFDAEELSRIYWQKNANNVWSADQEVSDAAMAVAFVDWGDALEAVSWTSRSKIRVETQPYSNLVPEFISPEGQVGPCFDTASDAGRNPYEVCKVGFQMWHVSGQGITEHWGARATEDVVPYNYDSPFQIINTNTAKLNLAKMEAGSGECPSPGGGEEGEGEEVAALAAYETPDVGAWNGSGWDNACTWRDAAYSVELSVGGKYVYGYNWDMKTVDLNTICPGWQKTGWWRLTFYTTDEAVDFNDAGAPTSAPPAVPAEARDISGEFPFNTATSTYVPAAGELYIPVVDVANNLTYLDICIVAKDQGGGGGGGGGNKPPAAGGGPGGKPGGSGTGGGSGGRGR